MCFPGDLLFLAILSGYLIRESLLFSKSQGSDRWVGVGSAVGDQVRNPVLLRFHALGFVALEGLNDDLYSHLDQGLGAVCPFF